MIQVTIDEAKEQLPELIDAMARGETVLIETGIGEGAQTMQLIAVPIKKRGTPRFGSARGLIETADDLDAPLEDFREYM